MERRSDGNGTVSRNEEKESLLDRVLSFYHQGDVFSERIEKWLYSNCDVFSSGSGEYTHELHELHEQFTAFFESQIESYVVEDCGASLEQFHTELSTAAEEKSSVADHFIFIANSSLKFETFVTLLQYAKDGDL
jgi:hypothetical protein